MTQTGQSKVYRTQGSTGLVIGEGGSLNAASGKVTLPGSLAKGYIDLSPYILGARQMASAENLISGTSAETAFWGGMLVKGATAGTPALDLTASGDQSAYLNWASAIVVAIKLAPIMMPGDMSTAGGLTVGLFGESVGTGTASDAKSALDIRCWMDIGDTEMGSTHPDFTSTPSLKTIALTSGNVSTGILNITLVPEAHAGRAIRLYGGRVDYTKKTS